MAAARSVGSAVLQRLRARMASVVDGGLAAYITPSGDAHHSEYVAEHDKRRAWLSGFTGSAGTAVVTPTAALMWTDGRYFLQAERQLSKDWTLMRMGNKGVLPLHEWLATNTAAGDRVGVDPHLFSVDEARRIEAAFRGKDVALVPVTPNLVDELWGEEQPPRPSNPIMVHPLKYTGQSISDKVALVRAAMAEAGATAVVVTALDELAWLFNIRGSDIPFNPVTYGYALVTPSTATLFTDASKITPEAEAHLAEVEVLPYEEVVASVAAAGSADGAKVWVDPSTCSLAIHGAIPEAHVLCKPSCITLAKAKKNDVEIEGMRQANIRDAAALVNFFSWLEAELAAGTTGLTEYTVSERLTAFRAEQDLFVSPSFETIAGSGPNGAIIHYKPEEATAAPVTADQMLLVDSGGQYFDGTTDTTRTVHFGTPTDYQRRCFTRVLQGHIALARAVFPEGTQGNILDGLARVALWQDGKIFQHGTGHGVGAFLNVHEGPQGISYRARAYKGGFVQGMTTSNEPGYYEEGAFGIRIESVHVAQPAGDGATGPRDGFLRFENFTPVPIQTKLVDASLLSADELTWLNDYNAWCRETVAPLVSGAAAEYLERETAPLSVGGGSGTGAGAGAGAGSK